MKRLLNGIGVLVVLLTSAGCWDRVEIESRGFVIGTAIDAADRSDYLLTYQFVVPSSSQSKSQGTDQGGKSYQNVSAEGRTLFQATRKMSALTSRAPYLEHNKIIILSEKLAREGKIEEVLDLFIRDPEMRRAAKVMVAVGDARKMLDVIPPIEKLPVQYINSTSENPDKSESITPPTNIGNVHRFLLEEHSYALPTVSKTDNEVSLSGAAVFNRDNKLRGFLNAEQTSGRNFFSGTIKAAALEIKLDGKPIVFELKRARRKITADVSDKERPAFKVDVTVEGNVGESYSQADLMSEAVQDSIEKSVEKKIESIMKDVLVKVQRDYRSDILGLGDYLNENHYAVWQSIKNDWDENKHLFSQCRVNVRVNAKIRIIGSIEKSQP